ncbi:Uncharacterized protein PBTT_01078 [Plasmodiophora brassicae]|uniref:Uncharacterized protein n=1 Tax=Plasmodiophora brassicae TaxID=37360 RepID=A0A0G4IZK3_PLABS|nr:hypothetical protein PBRA_001711 [Plasmodiophora brassicae]
MDELYLRDGNGRALLQLVYVSEPPPGRDDPQLLTIPQIEVARLLIRPPDSGWVPCDECDDDCMEAEGSLERDGVEDRPMSVMACLKRCREHPERIPAMAVRAHRNCADAILIHCCTTPLPASAFGAKTCLASGLPAPFASLILTCTARGSFHGMDPSQASTFINAIVDVGDPATNEKVKRFLLSIHEVKRRARPGETV